MSPKQERAEGKVTFWSNNINIFPNVFDGPHINAFSFVNIK